MLHVVYSYNIQHINPVLTFYVFLIFRYDSFIILAAIYATLQRHGHFTRCIHTSENAQFMRHL